MCDGKMTKQLNREGHRTHFVRKVGCLTKGHEKKRKQRFNITNYNNKPKS
jgi:hypothetical protein